MDTRKILSLLVMLSVLSQSFVVYWADTESDFNDTRTRVFDVQAENSSLPTTLPVDERKWSIGYIMSRLFDSQWRIGNWYIKAFKDVEDNAVAKELSKEIGIPWV